MDPKDRIPGDDHKDFSSGSPPISRRIPVPGGMERIVNAFEVHGNIPFSTVRRSIQNGSATTKLTKA